LDIVLVVLPWTAYAIQKTLDSSALIRHKLKLIGYKLNVYPLLQILVTRFSANSIPWTRITSSAAWERRFVFAVVHVNAS
jgi:hypothetical protein